MKLPLQFVVLCCVFNHVIGAILWTCAVGEESDALPIILNWPKFIEAISTKCTVVPLCALCIFICCDLLFTVTPKRSRPKSLAISTPTKLLSLEEARTRALLLSGKVEQEYIEVGECWYVCLIMWQVFYTKRSSVVSRCSCVSFLPWCPFMVYTLNV